MYQNIYPLLLFSLTYFHNGKVNSFTINKFRYISSKSHFKFHNTLHETNNEYVTDNDKSLISALDTEPNDFHRRNFLKKNLLYLSTFDYIVSTNPKRVNAIESINDTDDNFNCLLDLPPVEEGYVRVYLCRHGQTEYNRLRLVQGSRVDPPLNEAGREMGRRIGLSLSKLPSSALPTITLHSELQRAEETARIASETLTQNIIPTENVQDNEKTFLLPTPLVKIKDLNEVDFGNLEGIAVAEARSLMTKSFAAWSIGALDKTFMENGENGLQVLQRIKNTLKIISDYGNQTKRNINNPKSILAVSHSTYLRALLCLCLDKSLAEVAIIDQKNGCINVIDVNLNEEEVYVPSTIRNSPFVRMVFSENEGNVDDDMFTFPKVKVIRINENRHLFGL